MGKITDISQQKKTKDRVNVYIDGEYGFSLSIWQLGEFKIKIGDEINREEIDKYVDFSELGKLYDKTLVWLTIRPRSEWEIKTYIDKKSSDEKLKSNLLEALNQKGFVNDHDFARRWIANRRLLKSMSKYKIKAELMAKKVPRPIIDEAISEDEVSDLKYLRQLVEKKRHKYSDEQKLMAYLSRQGYGYGDIKQVLSEDNS